MKIGTPLADILEDAWDAQLFRGPKALANMLSWTTYHVLRSRGSRAGYPDRTCVRERIIFVELKREKTKPTPDQVEWLDKLATAGGEVYLWRPSDLEEVGLILARRWRYDPVMRDLRNGTDSLLPGSMWIPGAGQAGLVKYRTIVVDPPWEYDSWPDESTSPKAATRSFRVAIPGEKAKRRPIAYPTMSVEQIAGLDIPAEADAHLFLWTTQRYLWDAREIVKGWGFTPSCVLTWCKEPRGIGPGGLFSIASEFVVYARRGSPPYSSRCDRTWWVWPRSNTHSRKPDAFLDVVEAACPGPYLEMFARRARFGWDYWGDESLGTATVESTAVDNAVDKMF